MPIFSSPSSFPLPSLSPAPTEQPSMPLGTQIHYGPKSAVKLVSLGSLTASGYMVHRRKDRSIVITKPNGDILCSCPVQPNNTWIFPSQLMTGNRSPEFQVQRASSLMSPDTLARKKSSEPLKLGNSIASLVTPMIRPLSPPSTKAIFRTTPTSRTKISTL